MTPRTKSEMRELLRRSRAKIADDVRTEFDAWVEERAQELVRSGTPIAEAQLQARREFGDMPAAYDYCVAEDVTYERERAWRRWLAEARSDIAIAWRGMVRSPGLALVLIATLALGVGATTAMFSAVYGILLHPLPYRDDARIVQLHTVADGELQPMGQLSSAAFENLHRTLASAERVAALSFGDGTLLANGEPTHLPGARVTGDMFTLLGVPAFLGRTLQPADDSVGSEPVMVLSYDLWQQLFGGDSTIIGRLVDFRAERRRVVGVMPKGFYLPLSRESRAWTPLPLDRLRADPDRYHNFRLMQVIARLRSQGDLANVQREVDARMQALATEFPRSYQGLGARLISLREETTGQVQPALIVLLGASLALLAIACANIASVLLAKTIAREPEIALRSALGAGGARIVRQLLSESLVLAVFGGAAGIAIAFGGTALLRPIAGIAVPAGMEISLNGTVLAVAFVTAVSAGLLFGLVPALAARRMQLRQAMGGAGRGTTGANRLRMRRALVAVQVALSIALLVSASLMTRTLRNLLALDLGYRTDSVLTFSVSLPSQRYDTPAREDLFFATAHEALARIPGVEAVGSAANVPLLGGSGASLVVEGQPYSGDRPPEVRYSNASDDYFRVLGIPLKQGRFFGPEDASTETRAVLISELAERTYFKGRNPIGARIRLGPSPTEPWNTIVGVVGDVLQGTSGAAQPTVYASQRHDRWGEAAFVLRVRGGALPIAAAARQAIRAIDPLLPVESARSLGVIRDQQLVGQRLPMQLIGGFSLLALVLAALGIYGVGAHLVTARRRELGVRMALGATSRKVRALVLKDGLVLVGLGCAVGVPLSLAIARPLRSLLYGVSAFDPLSLVGVVAVMIVIALVSMMHPAHRATSVEPSEVLRSP